jgi:hypothetical protein
MEVTMIGLKDHMHEFEEQPGEADLENPQLEMEIPDVHWAKDIVQIENPILKERKILVAKKIFDKEYEFNTRIESGELSQFDAESEKPKHLNTRLTF